MSQSTKHTELKEKALNAIDGAADDQFALLWDYAEELRKSNPRSNVIMMMTDSDDGNVNKKFAKFYVMFDALRVGFLSGCRPIIGVDGCHLKGPHGGVLLTAVSIDPNNNLYPLAYAIVSGETREAWEWFLGLLKSDLNMVREDAYTFISDKQKGLIPAFESVFPGSDKRYCVRHLHGNMKTAGFKGLAYKSALWNVARATTESEFKKFSCSCRKWDLTGIPCNHAMSAICSQVLDPEDFVNPCYSVQTFKKVYRYAIMPVNGPKLWAQTGNIPPLPPNFGRKAGRKKDHFNSHIAKSGVYICWKPTPYTRIQSQEVNVMEEQVSHPLRHIFSQYSNVNEASGSESQVTFLTKGGKRFVTMTNLPAAIHATKKKKPNT
ncbi:hypothetical protein Sango_0156000 [Sesamum angolense]|uniref:SWIM-type domain-containing protein n=1 Tax=Sesamum angolense TaxID=2727404 RepID=A0AAE1XFC5_9LAMI|nr:hypothetical protein Sango_0156000 [Sesamum angolense]